MIQIQGRSIRRCGAILAALLVVAAAGAPVQGTPAEGPDRGPVVSARGGKAAGRGKQRQAPPKKPAGGSAGNRKSGGGAAPPPKQRQAPSRKPASRSAGNRKPAGSAAPPPKQRQAPTRTPTKRSAGSRKPGRGAAPPPKQAQPKRPTATNRPPATGGNDGKADPRRRVINRRIGDRPGARPKPDVGPDGTSKGPAVGPRPGPGTEGRPPTQPNPRRRPGDADQPSVSPRRPGFGPDGDPGTRSIPRGRPGDADKPSVSRRRPGFGIDGSPRTPSIPKDPPGGAGPTTPTRNGPPNTSARPRGGIVDGAGHRLNDRDGGPTHKRDPWRKKDSGHWRPRGSGYKGRRTYSCGHRRSRSSSWCWCWYWYWGFPSYRYYRYCGLPWYGYWPFYDRHNYYYYYEAVPQATSTIYTSAPYGSTVYVPDPCPVTMADAWEQLAGGRADDALEAFDCLATELPDDGLPLIGFALAASLLDEHEDATAAMREAVRIDPEALRYVPDDVHLRDRLGQLVAHYESRARQQYGDVDALFMVAALWYLLGQEDTARYAIGIAVTLGDADAGTLNLQALLEAPPDG